VPIAAGLSAVVLLLLLGIGIARAKSPVDLRQERKNLPYRFRTVATMDPRAGGAARLDHAPALRRCGRRRRRRSLSRQ
jgi:hypothetical protein